MTITAIDRTAIMHKAWEIYRAAPAWDRDGKFTARATATFNRERFRNSLRDAWSLWRQAKRAEAQTADDRRARITAEIAALDYRPLHMNVSTRRADLKAQLSQIAA